jgi:parallel beta-helix repeat protein
VTIKGSQEVGGWVLVSPGVYAVTWSGDEPQQIFRNGVLLRQIGGTIFNGYPFTPTPDLAGLHASEGGVWPGRVNGGVADLTADSFIYDTSARRLVVRVSTPLGGAEKLEVSTRQHVLQAESANNLTIEGIDFAHANTTRNRRWGAVKVVGKFNALRNLAVRDMDGTCVQLLGEDNALLDSTIERCGQTGVAGHGRRLTVANNQVLSNNTRGFNKWWEAGGMKFIGDSNLHDAVIANNVVAYNAGDGIWLDTKNTNILIEGNTAAYNAGFGVHYEASQTGTIRGNRVYGNALRGIYLFESSKTVVESNAVFGNAMEGIGVVDGSRSAADPALKPFDNRVINNTVAWNDFERNWVQLVLPGDAFRSTSENNAFKAERLAPRMSMAFVGANNPAFDRLDLWRSSKRLDLNSTTQTTPMPADLKAALAARRLLTTNQLPATLAAPGSY